MSLSQIPGWLGLKTRTKVGKHTSYGVTPLGKQKAEQMTLDGPRFKVLAHIAEEGPCSLGEIERECGLSEEKAKSVLRSLMGDRYVQPATGE